METTSNSQFEGLLQKPARIIGRTTEVWCVLDGQSLMFFKENKRSSCIGHIDISDIQTIRKVGTKDSQFEILTSEKPQIFTAESSDLCKEWITHIQHAMSTKGQEIPSDTTKSEHTPARQKENFHVDLKSVKDKWKQRESKKGETRGSTTPPPKKLSLTQKAFPFNKDMNEAAHTTQDECNKQAPAARTTSDSSEIETPSNNLEMKDEGSIEKNSDVEKKLKSEKSIGDENRIEQNKNEIQVEAPTKVQNDSVIGITSVNNHNSDIQEDTSPVELKEDTTENKSDQLDSNVEEEPVVLLRKSRNVNGTNERKTLDGNHHKSQGPTTNTTGDTTSVTNCSVAVGIASDKTSSVIDGASVGETNSDEGNGTPNDVTAEETTTEESKINVHETADIDVSMETTQKTLNRSTENGEETSDKVVLRKSSSGSSKEHLNALGTSNVSMVTARKTFPYTAETQGNQPDEDAVVLRPKSTSSRLASRSKSSSQKSTSDSRNPNGVAVAGKEEEKVITKPENGETQKLNGESVNNNLPEEDNPLLKVCKTEEIPSLDVVKSEEMTAWEELRNYLTSNFGPLNSLINGGNSEERTKEDDNPVLALKEYLNNFS